MRKGAVRQRHSASCPRDENGELVPHRCRGSWEFVVDSGRRPDGRRRQTTKRGFSTKRAAEEALAKEVDLLDAGFSPDRSLTVGQFFMDWMLGKRNLRPTTRRNYEYTINRYLAPALGSVRLRDLEGTHIDALYNDLLSGRYGTASTAQVHHVHRVLRSALSTAVKRRLVPWNAAHHVELPEHRAAKSLLWEPEDIGRFLDVASQHRLYPLFHVMTFTGMRRGEAIGLHWSNVDLVQGYLEVTQQITDVAGFAPGPTKTKAGRRRVPLDDGTVEVLRRHARVQRRERELCGAGWQDLGLVFTREDGSCLRPHSVTHLFTKLVKQAEVPLVRLHDLRHTHATMALLAGVDIKVVSDRLGHSNSAVTRDLYTHVLPAVARGAAEDIAAAIGYVRGRGGGE